MVGIVPRLEQAQTKDLLRPVLLGAAAVRGALAIIAMLLLAPGLTTHLPQATLAAIVIVAATSLVDLGGLKRLIRLRPTEAVLSLVCFVGVTLVGVVAGSPRSSAASRA